MLPTDTKEVVQRIYDQKIRNLSAEERFLKGLSLTHLCRKMCLEGLKQRYPQASHKELKKIFYTFLYKNSFLPNSP